MKIEITKYIPGKWIKGKRDRGELYPVPGLAAIVADVRKLGYRVTIDMERDGEHYEEVTAANVKLAVHEVEPASVNIWDKNNKPVGWFWVIPENDTEYEWLADWTMSDWFDEIVEKHTN